MALGIFLSISALRRGGALAAVTRTLLAEVWRRGILPVGGGILFVGIGMLPLLVTESTDAGSRIHSLLEYGQGWIAATLLVLSLLMSCGSYCDEVVTGRIRWLVVRPGAKWALLPGKCLGILVALFLLLVPATLFLLLLVGRASEPPVILWNPQAVAVVTPETLEVTDQEVESYLVLQMLEDPQGWGLLETAEGQRRARSRIERLSRSIPVGSSHDYWFEYPSGLEQGAVISMRPSLGRVHRSQRARLRVQLADVKTEVVIRNGERSSIEIPDSLIEANQFKVGIQFLGAVEEDVRISSVLWNGSDAIELRVPDGTLVSALIRSQLLTWVRCGFIAALGLTVSTFLGMPVATLFVLCFLIAAAGGGFAGSFDTKTAETVADPRSQEPLQVVVDALARAGDFIIQQLSAWNQHATGARVAAGENVTTAEVFSGLGLIGLLWGGTILLVGIFISARQEHGLGRDR